MLGLVLAYSDVRKNLAWGDAVALCYHSLPPGGNRSDMGLQGGGKGAPMSPKRAGHDQEQGGPVEPRMAPFGPEFKRKKRQTDARLLDSSVFLALLAL